MLDTIFIYTGRLILTLIALSIGAIVIYTIYLYGYVKLYNNGGLFGAMRCYVKAYKQLRRQNRYKRASNLAREIRHVIARFAEDDNMHNTKSRAQKVTAKEYLDLAKKLNYETKIEKISTKEKKAIYQFRVKDTLYTHDSLIEAMQVYHITRRRSDLKDIREGRGECKDI